MIYMFLSPMEDLGDNQLFMGQKYLQVPINYTFRVVSYGVNWHAADGTVFFFVSVTATIDGARCCTMDADSKAISFEETTWGSVHKTSQILVVLFN